MLVHQFGDFLRPIRIVFNGEVSLAKYIELQQYALHGVEARVLKHVPKVSKRYNKCLFVLFQIVYVICERLLELCHLADEGTLGHKLALLAGGDDLFYENILDAQVCLRRRTYKNSPFRNATRRRQTARCR